MTREKKTKGKKATCIGGGLVLAAVLMAAAHIGGGAAYAAENTAASMKLKKAEGTVDVRNSSRRKLTLTENLLLYNGYQVGTEEESYAWVDLDSVKLTKLDAASRAGIRKKDKKLEIFLESGGIFFNVTEPLKDDESLTIRTSTMIAGIRGTSGWVRVVDGRNVQISVLEGTVAVKVKDPVSGETRNDSISGGETAVCAVERKAAGGGTCSIRKEELKKEDISGFVLEEVSADEALKQKIYEKGGIDLRDVTKEEAQKRLQEDEGEVRRKMEKVETARRNQLQFKSTRPVWEETEKIAAAEPATPAAAATPTPAPKPAQTPEPEPVWTPGQTDTPDSLGTPETPGSSETPGQSGTPGTNTGDPSLKPPAAGSDSEASGTLAGGLTWKYAGGVLTVSGRGAMPDYNVPDEQPWAVNRNNIKSVVISDGVTHIGNFAFYDCRALQSAAIPAGVTSIGAYAFDACPNLVSATLPAGLERIENDAFAGCGIENIRVPASVSHIGFRAFSGFKRLAVTVDPENAYYCDENGILFNKGRTTLMQYPAGKSAEAYQIPQSVQNIDYYAFADSKLKSVTISENVFLIGLQAFWHCRSLENITIPVTVTLIENNAFEGCSGLTTVTYEGTRAAWDGMTGGKNIFSNISPAPTVICRGGEGADAPASDFDWDFSNGILTIRGHGAMPDYPDYADGRRQPWAANRNNITRIVISEGITSIGDWAFERCSSLTSIEIPTGVTSIGAYAFAACSGLAGIEIPTSVTGIGAGAFTGCSSLARIEIPTGVTSIEHNTFESCSSLTDIAIPASVTSIGKAAFFGCSGLTNVSIPAGVTSMGNAVFSLCRNLTMVTFKGTQDEWEALTNGKDMFLNIDVPPTVICTDTLASDFKFSFSGVGLMISGHGAMPDYSLSDKAPWVDMLGGITKIVISEGITSIGSYAFANCSSLTSIDIPTSVVNIGMCAFYNCSQLTGVSILPGVTSIGNSAFSGCSGLTSLDIPAGVTGIGLYAFARCSSLTNVTFGGTQAEWDALINGKNIFYEIDAPPAVTCTGIETPTALTVSGDDVAASGSRTVPDDDETVSGGDAAGG